MSPTRDHELRELLDEGHAALNAPPVARVSEALTVLPKLVSALDRICLYQTELRDVSSALTGAVRKFREAVWAGMKENPDATYQGGKIEAELNKVNMLLTRLDRLIYTSEGT